MPAWPKCCYTFGLSLATAATEWRLRRKHADTAAQERAYAFLTSRLAAASFWRDAGLAPRLPYAEFKARVPLFAPEQLAPAIARMVHGESDVLWPGRCTLFALSAGTTTGSPKSLPVTEDSLAHFRRATRDALLYYTVRVKHAGVFRGRLLLLGSATAPKSVASATSPAALAGDLSSITAMNLPAWAVKHLYEPRINPAPLDNWDARLAAIVTRTSQRDISLVAGIPPWVLELGQKLQERAALSGRGLENLQTLWPNLECCLHTGTPLTLFAASLKTLLGPTVRFHEVYAAAEGIIATQDTDSAGAGLRLMTGTGLFFEFLPMTDFDETRLAALGARAMSLAEVRTGVDYALILTTPGGLARYVVGDVVRFVSTSPPRVVVVGRTALRLNAFGENVTEKELTEALAAVCARRDWTPVNFHVAPLLANSLTGQHRGGHEWWIELKPGTVATPYGPQIAADLDGELQRTNPGYAARRRSGPMDAPVVRLVMPGVFEHLLRFQGRWGGLHRMARCRSDRQTAGELAQVTNFAD